MIQSWEMDAIGALIRWQWDISSNAGNAHENSVPVV
jgi:hypothetical protein